MVRCERGSASVMALLIIPVLCFGAFALIAFAQLAMLRQQLRTAADLSALAAAQALSTPNCDRALQIAQAHQVALIECLPSGADWIVGVSAPAPQLIQQLASMLGRSATDQVQYATAGYSSVLGAPTSNS